LRAVPPSKTKQLNRLVHQALNECGFNEAITVTLVESKVANLFTNVPNDNILRVVGDRRLATDAIRCSLLPSLLAARRLNQDAGNEISNLYEIAHVFLPGEANALPKEHQSLAILNSQADLLAIRGVLELIAKRANSSEKIYLVPKEMQWFLLDQSAAIMLGDKQIGIIGTITPAIQKQFELRKPAAVAQLNYDILKELPLDPIPVMLLPKFPAIVRDLSIIVDERLQWAQIELAINALKLTDLEAVEFGELFRGKQIPKGQKSLFFSLRYRNSDRSLTHEEVDQEQNRVIEALTNQFKAQLRAS
jgi:phenylalanyl-tRNA synthetase beta chain